MTDTSDAKTSFTELSEEALVAAFLNNPELVKKAQKAMSESKRLETKKKLEEELKEKASAQGVMDQKIYAKAIRMIQNAHNTDNEAEFVKILEGQNVNLPPKGLPSLLTVSLEFLATKERVMFNWPHVLTELGAKAGVDETFAMVQLYTRRDVSSLGGKSLQFPTTLFTEDFDWKEIEKGVAKKSKEQGGSFHSLPAFYVRINQYYRHLGYPASVWFSLGQLIRSGCDQVNSDNHGHGTAWQDLAAIAVKDGTDPESLKLYQERVNCFKAMLEHQWIGEGRTILTDNLLPNRLKKTSSQSYYHNQSVNNTPSRAFLPVMHLANSSLDIFKLLCDYEDKNGITTPYDEVGRSRLYFANERLRSLNYQKTDQDELILLKIMQECLERGDKPESVNAQNFYAKAANIQVEQTLHAWVEKREISSYVPEATKDKDAGSAEAPKKAAPRL